MSEKCTDCGSPFPCKCCEWCEMFPCECVDENGDDYNATERLLDKVAVTNPAAALALADVLSGNE